MGSQSSVSRRKTWDQSFVSLLFVPITLTAWSSWPLGSGVWALLWSFERKVKVLVDQLCLALGNLMDCSLSIEFSKQEYWSGFPFPSLGGLPHPGIESRSPALQVDSLLFEPTENLRRGKRNLLRARCSALSISWGSLSGRVSTGQPRVLEFCHNKELASTSTPPVSIMEGQ